MPDLRPASPGVARVIKAIGEAAEFSQGDAVTISTRCPIGHFRVPNYAQALPPHYSPVREPETDPAVGPYGYLGLATYKSGNSDFKRELLMLSLTPASYGGQRLTPRLVWKRAKAEQLVNHSRPIDNEERTAQ
jgi:hypothetical protein